MTLGPADDLGRWIEEFLQLEASGWKGRRGSALACTEVNRRFATDVLTGAFRRGRLQMGGLDFDGRPIGRRSSLLAGDGAYAFKTAYDETMAEFSPGVMLELDGVRQLDATPGLRMDRLAYRGRQPGARAHPGRRARRCSRSRVALGAWGGVAAATLPALRWARRRLAFE